MARPTPVATGTSTPRPTTAWTTAGLFTLPLYAVLLVFGTWTPQPDQVSDPEGWARFVASTSYLISHVLTNVVGSVLAVLGTFALGAVVSSRAPRLGPIGLVLATAGQVLLTVPGVISTFATPAIAEAYLRGTRDVMSIEFSGVMTVLALLGLLLTVAGNVALGVAVARTRVLPRWSGVTWVVGTVVFYLLGALLGMATTGASLPTQPVGAALLAVSGAAMAWTNLRHRAADADGPAQRAATTGASQSIR